MIKNVMITVAKCTAAVFYVGFALGCMKSVNGGNEWKIF